MNKDERYEQERGICEREEWERLVKDQDEKIAIDTDGDPWLDTDAFDPKEYDRLLEDDEEDEDKCGPFFPRRKLGDF